VFVFRV